MTAAFIVTVELDDLSDLAAIAEDLTEAVELVANVIDVKPWARPSLGPAVAPPPGLGMPTTGSVTPFPYNP